MALRNEEPRFEEAMTDKEFIVYASDMLFGEGDESFWEIVGEIKNEVAMFGDSGPGTMLHVRRMVQERNNVARQYTRLTGTEVKPLAIPYLGHR